MHPTAEVVDLEAVERVACPCGWARRGFTGVPHAPASVHLVDVEADAQTHRHASHTEIYVILECARGAAVELDGEPCPVRPMTALMIRPGVKHRAIGRMRILNVVIPPFDPQDELVD